MIAQLAVQRGHCISAKIDLDSKEDPDFSNMDVAIDFSTPDAAVNNILSCFGNKIPVVSGTTGWLSQFENVVEKCREENGAFIYSSNFSLGVNIFFELNRQLAKMMKGLDQYTVSIEELHHVHKLDAPSGTAITLAEDIMSVSEYRGWKSNTAEENHIPIYSEREGQHPGTHIIDYNSTIDQIRIKHTAHNREGFALGAIIAAEWLQNKTGVFSMKDVLNLG